MIPFSIISNTNIIPPGKELYKIKQTSASQRYSYTIPEGITSINVVCVGHGSFAGGGLSYRNFITVTPGEILYIDFSTTTTNSSNSGNAKLSRVNGELLCIAYCGAYGTSASTYNGGLGGKNANSINDGGANGGKAITTSSTQVWRRGGGAAGYTGNGGDAVVRSGNPPWGAPAANSGGGGGGVALNQDPITGVFLGGNVGIGGIGTTAVGLSSSGNGNDGSPFTIMCGGGVFSTTSNFNGGCRITTGNDFIFP